MNLLCVGISHHTASLEMRERLWFSEEEIRATLPKLKDEGFLECVLFSTCNRTELYVLTSESDFRVDFLKKFLIGQKSAQAHLREENLFSYFASGAAEHLFRVASGIDSMIVGDVQILSQVKSGFNLALGAGTAGFFMNKLFQSALHIGKRSRRETHISEGAVSVSYAAVELAQRIFDDLGSKNALVIGAGDTAQLTAKHLLAKGVGNLFITNRTQERAELLAKMVGGTVLPFDRFTDHLPEIDIIIASVNADTYILTENDIARMNKARHGNALFLIDIGVPRNIDPAVKELDNIFLYDLDSLNGLVQENVEKREAEIPRIREIIGEELAILFHWHSALQASPTIAALTQLIEQIRKEEVGKNIHRFAEQDQELVELVTRRIVNKILHTPIVNLKNGHDESHNDRLNKISIVRKLFGLDARKEQSHAG